MIKRPLAVESRMHHAFHADPLVSGPGIHPENVHGTILVVDSGDHGYLFALRMLMYDWRVLHRPQSEAVCDLFQRISVDIVLLNHSPENSAISLLDLFKSIKPSVPVLIMAENGSEVAAIETFRHGARDYFPKPLPLEEVARALRGLMQVLHGGSVSRCGLQKGRIEKPLSYIHDNYTTALSLKELSEKTGASLSTLARLIKKRTGMTFVDYVHSLRIHAACKMLRDPSGSLLQIALDSGYSNQSHFNRVFKKFIGVSPGQYRKSFSHYPR